MKLPQLEKASILHNHLRVSEPALDVDKNKKTLELVLHELSNTEAFVKLLHTLPDEEAAKKLKDRIDTTAEDLERLVNEFEENLAKLDAAACCEGSRLIRGRVADLVMLDGLGRQVPLFERAKRLLSRSLLVLPRDGENWLYVSNIQVRRDSLVQLATFSDSNSCSTMIQFAESLFQGLDDALRSLRVELEQGKFRHDLI